MKDKQPLLRRLFVPQNEHHPSLSQDSAVVGVFPAASLNKCSQQFG